MKKYRILEIECYGGRKVYEVQRRFLLWWRKWLRDNPVSYKTGIYDTLAEAEHVIEQDIDMYVKKKTVVKTY